MQEETSAEAMLHPVHVNSFGIPNRVELMPAYKVYKPAKETLTLRSELGRTLFPEVFIENPLRGPLSELAVSALARGFGPKMMPFVKDDPMMMRVHYDALDIDLPLEKCYEVDDELYWRRVVLAKHRDRTLALKKHAPWKSLGVALKFAELVEQCSAEYWPEEEMLQLAKQIKPFVTAMHIRTLKPLQEHSFDEFFDSDSSASSDESSEESSDDSSFMDYEDFAVDVEEEEIGEEEEGQGEGDGEGSAEGEDERRKTSVDAKTARRIEIEAIMAAERDERHRQLREARKARFLAREERHKARDEAKSSYYQEPEPVKKKRKKKITGVFDIPVVEEEDEQALIVDRRNIRKYVARKKKFNYPPKHCHHVSLRFVSEFEYMTSLTVEFKPPSMGINYHSRNFNFSYVDTQNLADGVSKLERLKTFRLINSRMDARKFKIILKALRLLQSLEELDFTNDQLQDNCATAIFEFFKFNSSLKRLELRGNYFNSQVLEKLSMGLELFMGSLEYLGLAGNWLADEGFHMLVNVLIDTNQVNTLCLRGAQISHDAVACCVANELVRKHVPLVELDLTGVAVGKRAGVELIKALDTNTRIMRLACQATDIPNDILTDIRLVLQRNQYLIDNPYINDETKTEEEINAFVNRVKHPILLDVFDRLEKKRECLEGRPEQFRRLTLENQPQEDVATLPESDIWSLEKLLMQLKGQPFEQPKAASVVSAVEEAPPFVFDPNTFNVEEFLRHVDTPGATERFFYFRKRSHRSDYDRDLLEAETEEILSTLTHVKKISIDTSK